MDDLFGDDDNQENKENNENLPLNPQDKQRFKNSDLFLKPEK